MALETWIMVGDAGGIEPACTDAPDGARPRGERKDALDTTVSSTSSFCSRRRRRRLLGRQAAGRGTTFGAGFAARRAASAPSPPHHLQSTRAHSAPSVGRCTGTSRPDLGVRAQLHRSARASRRAAKGPRAGRWQVDRWEQLRPPTRLEPAAAGRRHAEQGDAWKKRWWHAQIKGFEPVPEEAVALAFFRVPRIKCFVQKVLN